MPRYLLCLNLGPNLRVLRQTRLRVSEQAVSMVLQEEVSLQEVARMDSADFWVVS